MRKPSKTPAKNSKRFLGCGCNTWLLGFVGLVILFIVLVSLPDTGDDVERSGILLTFTATPISPTDTPLPTDTPIPPTATAEPTPQPTATPVPILVPTDTPQPAQQPAPILPVVPDASLSDCVCDSNTLNCGDFVDPFDAQACYLRCMQVVGFDVHKLDRDSDGNACEWDR